MEPEQVTEETPTEDAQGGGQQPAQQPGQEVQPTDRVFTQADVDRIIADRLKRQAQQYKDYDDLKGQAAKWAEYEEAQKTELQRIQDRAAAAEAERDSAVQQANDRLIQGAFVSEAAKAGAAHPEDAFYLADLSGVQILDDGAVAGVADAVKALLDGGRLVLKGRPSAPSLDGGAGGGARPSEAAPALSPEELEVARRLGVKPEDYVKFKKQKEFEQ